MYTSTIIIALALTIGAGCSAAVDHPDQAPDVAPESGVEYPEAPEVVAPIEAPELPHVCDDGDPCTDDYQPQPGNCGHVMIRGCV